MQATMHFSLICQLGEDFIIQKCGASRSDTVLEGKVFQSRVMQGRWTLLINGCAAGRVSECFNLKLTHHIKGLF